jgi:hypothetical protein
MDQRRVGENIRKNGGYEMKLVDERGNLRFSISLVIGVLGCMMVVAPLYFEFKPLIVIGGFLVGMLLMGFSSIALRSATLDLRAFTNDPIGWRKAKETYKTGGSSDEVTKKKDNSP